MPNKKKKVSKLANKRPTTSVNQPASGATQKITVVSSTQPAKGGVQKKKTRFRKRDNPLFEKRPRNFGIGNDIQPKRDLTRFVRWPRYIRLQRQKRVLMKRLKVPPVINQFTRTIDKQTAHELFTLLNKYAPETKKQRKARLLNQAKKVVKAKTAEEKEKVVKQPKVRRNIIKYGLNHITSLIERKQTKLVIIAHDVEPIELVMWLPTLCRKMGIPYLIVKGKARLGKVVHKKTAAALAVYNVDQKDQNDLQLFLNKAKDNFLDRYTDMMKSESVGVMGHKHHARLNKEKRRVEKEKRTKGAK